MNSIMTDRCVWHQIQTVRARLFRKKFLTHSERTVCECVVVSLNTEATTVTIKRGKKLGYALPLNTDFQSVENLKKFDLTKCPLHANQECILKRINELKSSKKLFSMKSETDDGLSIVRTFPRGRQKQS